MSRPADFRRLHHDFYSGAFGERVYYDRLKELTLRTKDAPDELLLELVNMASRLYSREGIPYDEFAHFAAMHDPELRSALHDPRSGDHFEPKPVLLMPWALTRWMSPPEEPVTLYHIPRNQPEDTYSYAVAGETDHFFAVTAFEIGGFQTQVGDPDGPSSANIRLGRIFGVTAENVNEPFQWWNLDLEPSLRRILRRDA